MNERELAEQILQCEEATGNGDQPPAQRALAKLEDQLNRWFGQEGARSLFARAFDRAAAVDSQLRLLRSNSSESAHANDVLSQLRGAGDLVTIEALITFTGVLLGLLTRLIGKKMVERIVRESWPALAGARIGATDAPGDGTPNAARPSHPAPRGENAPADTSSDEGGR